MFNRNKIDFPPQEHEDTLDKMNEWSAWYSGSSQRLLEYYSQKFPRGTTKNSSFWNSYVQEAEERVHIPLATDISKYSAGLLFSEPPTLSIREANEKNPSRQATRTQERLREIADKGKVYQSFVEGAESASALGGTYFKVNWDRDIADVPLVSTVQADNALPVFKYGFLTQVSFFKEYKKGAGATYRHFEVHTKGKIENKLYKGNSNGLGSEVSLGAIEETKGLEPEVDTGINKLLVVYVPNDLPNRLWRNKSIGNSDYHGLIGLMDSLDEVYSSLMREIRLSKADKVVPESWLSYSETNGKLEYRDKMTYTGMNVPPDEMQQPILIQPKIRTDKYIQSILHLTDRIVDSAGYAPQSFGLNIKNRAESGTALRIRERKSLKTRAKKEKYFRQPLEELLKILLLVDRNVFNTNIDPELTTHITFADSIQEDPTEIASSLRDIEQAIAMSIEQKVKSIHPDWSDKQVMSEVQKIKEENEINITSNKEA